MPTFDEYINELQKFKDREGHCRVPARYETDTGYKLAAWVAHQRRLKEQMPSENIKRLDTLDFSWDPRAELWEEGFNQLQEFKDREGHCRVPVHLRTETGFMLGRWLRKQKMSQEVLSIDCIQRLKALGIGWWNQETRIEITTDNNPFWLSELILHAADKNWCVKMNCTTCGAGPFRQKLKKILDPNSVNYTLMDRMKLTKDQSLSTIEGLRQLDDGQSLSQPENHEETIMLLLLQCWDTLPEKSARDQMQVRLENTLAGDILNKMIAHYARRTGN